MASEYLLIPQVTKHTKNWTVRITVTEEISTITCHTGLFLKRYIFTDGQGNKIVASIYGTKEEVNKIDSALCLYKVYDITGAHVKEVGRKYNITGKWQWYLQRKTLIREMQHCKPTTAHMLDGLTPLSLLINCVDDGNNTVDVIGILIKCKELRHVITDGGSLAVQDFTIVGREDVVVRISVWEQLLSTVAATLVQATENYAVVIARRLTVKRHGGISLSTKNCTSFAIDPPVEETENLKSWFRNVGEMKLPLWLSNTNSDMCRELIESGRIKLCMVCDLKQEILYGDCLVTGHLQIVNEAQKLFYVSCKICASGINVVGGIEYHCRECNQWSVTVPRAFVILTLRDQTGSIEVLALEEVAENILQTSAHNLARLVDKGERYNLDFVKSELEKKKLKIILKGTFGTKDSAERKLLVQMFYEDGSSETGIREQASSPLKRKINDFIVGSPVKKQPGE